KIEQLSKKTSQEEFFSSPTRTSYSPSFDQTANSASQEKFSFPNYDLTNDNSTPQSPTNSPNKSITTAQDSYNNRNSASVAQGAKDSTNDSQGISSTSSLNTGNSISSPTFITLND